jgi:orotate phosphoribosyltransferase-like protein
MHSNDTKDHFLELRAKGLSLARIAADIHVSQRTLVDNLPFHQRHSRPEPRRLWTVDSPARRRASG